MAKARKKPMDRLASRKKPVSDIVSFANDPTAARELAAAEQLLTLARQAKAEASTPTARQAANSALTDAEAAVEEAKAAVEAGGVSAFRVTSLSRQDWEDLIDAHPPTAAERKRAEDRGLGVPAWNQDTFPPALLALSIALLDDDDPDQPEWLTFTPEEAQELWDARELNPSECGTLFQTCVEVNQTHRVVELGKGSRKIRPSR